MRLILETWRYTILFSSQHTFFPCVYAFFATIFPTARTTRSIFNEFQITCYCQELGFYLMQETFLIHTAITQWALWRLKSPTTRLSVQPFVQANNKEIIRGPLFYRWPVEAPHKGPVMRKVFTCRDLIVRIEWWLLGICKYYFKITCNEITKTKC